MMAVMATFAGFPAAPAGRRIFASFLVEAGGDEVTAYIPPPPPPPPQKKKKTYTGVRALPRRGGETVPELVRPGLASSAPSSGISISKVKAVAFERGAGMGDEDGEANRDSS